jgi:hypothetical protein
MKPTAVQRKTSDSAASGKRGGQLPLIHAEHAAVISTVGDARRPDRR